MNINTDASIYASLMSTLRSSDTTQSAGSIPPPPSPDMDNSNLDISAIGQQLSQMSDSQKSALQDFLKKINDAASGGTLDASALSKQAPDFLQSLASSLGVNMTDLVNALASIQLHANRPPPITRQDMQAFHDFHQQVLAAVKNGSFNAQTMAQSAPDAVVAMAKQHGINVTDLVNWMAQHNMPQFQTGSDGSQAKPVDLAAMFNNGAREVHSLASILTQFAQG